MLKKKCKQNQSVVADETKNNVVADTQQDATQPDATKPQERGRSMVEMLGTLAIIGVLSIGGVQGYRYAMHKYHSNEIVNELNLINAQLAIFMNNVHEEESVMSLGAPYDTTETTKTGGYVFAYGCGQDPTSTTPCDLDETGYYMTLSGVSRDVCQSATQMTANMMNLVEQRINGHTDNDGVLCQDGDNQLTFLFDANEGGVFDDGDGGADDNGGEATNPYNPENTYPYDPEATNPAETYPYGEETTNAYPEVTAPLETVVTDVNCPTGYFNMNGSCRSCNQKAPYTGVDLYVEELRKCSNRTTTCGTTCSMFCDSYLNTCPSGYVMVQGGSCSSQGIPIVSAAFSSGSWNGFDCMGSNNACCEPEGVYTGPIYTEPLYTEPVYTEPLETEPLYTEPVYTEPLETEPLYTEPLYTEPLETEPLETTLNCDVPYCDWTGWLDSGKPDYTPTGGDVESVENLCKGGWVGDIQCRAAMWPNTPLDQLEQYGLICNTEVGLVCRNQDQKPGGATPPACVNYQINVNCCYKPAGCE